MYLLGKEPIYLLSLTRSIKRFVRFDLCQRCEKALNHFMPQVSKKAESVQKLRAGLPSANADLIDGQIRYNYMLSVSKYAIVQLYSWPDDLRSR